MPQKIGQDILSQRYNKVQKVMGINSLPEHVYSVINVLKRADRPLNISEIQRAAKIKSWIVAQKIVYSLEKKGVVVKVLESGLGKYYVIKKENLNNYLGFAQGGRGLRKKKRVQRLPRISGQIVPT